MIGLDTNVIVRFVMRDDERQAQLARALVEGAHVLLATTVLIECEWVLRGTYDLPVNRIGDALLGLCSLPNVTIERPQIVHDALAAYSMGADFADAIHILSAEAAGADEFATFDKSLRRRAAHFCQSIKAIAP